MTHLSLPQSWIIVLALRHALKVEGKWYINCIRQVEKTYKQLIIIYNEKEISTVLSLFSSNDVVSSSI
jgi:hypothetical protein